MESIPQQKSREFVQHQSSVRRVCIQYNENIVPAPNDVGPNTRRRQTRLHDPSDRLQNIRLDTRIMDIEVIVEGDNVYT